VTSPGVANLNVAVFAREAPNSGLLAACESAESMSTNFTTVPLCTMRARSSASPLVRRMQRCYSVLPILSVGSAVDAVRGCGKIAPNQTDWLFGPGLMVSGSSAFTPFQANFGL
jgi:hypothetical protein